MHTVKRAMTVGSEIQHSGTGRASGITLENKEFEITTTKTQESKAPKNCWSGVRYVPRMMAWLPNTARNQVMSQSQRHG